MSDLGTKIRRHYEEAAPPIDIDSLVDRLERSPIRPRPQIRRGLAVAFVAALLLLIAVAVPILLNNPSEDPVIDSSLPSPTPPSTLSDAPPSTLLQPTPIPDSGFATIPIDTEGVVGSNPAIAIAPNGAPVMAYQGQRDFNVAVCADPACTSLQSVVTVAEAEGDVNWLVGPSLTLLPDGSPVAAFGFVGDNDSQDLHLAICEDPACSSWTTTVIATIESGETPVAITINESGLPVVAYPRGATLELAVCEDASCSTVSKTTVDDGSWVGNISAAPGTPPAFLYTMDGETHLAVCADASCGELTIATIDAGNYRGPIITRGPSGLVIATVDTEFAEAGGDPGTSGDIVVMTCRDEGCQDRTVGVVGSGSDIDIIGLAIGADGAPMLAYQSFAGGRLEVVHCNDPECTDGVTAGSPARRGEAALAVGTDGNPLIAYSTGSDLILIRCADSACVEIPAGPPSLEALSFSDPGWTVHVASDQAFDWPAPQVDFAAGGSPVIFYQGRTGETGPGGEEESALAVVKCIDPSCSQTTGANPMAFDQWFGGGLALDGEALPVGAFWSYATGRMLGFARCDDPECASATVSELIEADAWPEPELAIDSHGLAVMAFQNYTFNPGPLQIAFCSDAACTSVEVVDLDFDCVDTDCDRFWTHNTTSLALTPDDRPVAVYSSSSGKTRLVVCDDPRCSSFSASTLDDTGSVYEAAEIGVAADGNPVIGFYADGTAKLGFCLDPSCTQVEVAELGEALREPWSPPKLALLGDGRAVVGFGAPDGTPRLAVCSYPCADPSVSLLADVAGSYTIVTGADGLPLVVFVDGVEGPPDPNSVPERLVVAKCTDPSCLAG